MFYLTDVDIINFEFCIIFSVGGISDDGGVMGGHNLACGEDDDETDENFYDNKIAKGNFCKKNSYLDILHIVILQVTANHITLRLLQF